MLPRLRLLIALLLPVLVLGGWLATDHLPVWTAIRYDAIRAGDGTIAPAACEVASLLRQMAARQSGTAGIDRAAAQTAARAGFAAQLPDLATDLPSNGHAVVYDLVYDGQRRPAWVITGALAVPRTAADGTALPIPAGIAFIDGETGAVLRAIVLASSPADPAAACPFDLRGALVDLARSPAFLLLAGYLALTMIGGVGVTIMRWRVGRRPGADVGRHTAA